MSSFLSPDNKIMQFITKLVHACYLNVLWLICSLPVVTVGASTSALFAVSLKMVRDEEGDVTRAYFRAFKRNFRQATKVWIPLLLAGVLIVLDAYVLKRLSADSVGWTLLTALLYVAAAAYLIVLMYVFALIVTFENTVVRTILNALIIGMKYLIASALMGGIYFLLAFVTINFFNPLGLFALGIGAFLCSYPLRRIMDVYVARARHSEDGQDHATEN